MSIAHCNLGILGFAHGHVNAYCSRWQQQFAEDVNLVGGWDHDADRLREAVATHRINAFSSVHDLLNRADIDAVVIGSETSLHADLVEQAARAGKSIVLQKPMALTLAEADRIVAAVKESDVRFTMAWQMRADPQNLKMKELVDSGAFGQILMVRRRHGLATHTWSGFEDSWHVKPELNRGMWADDAAHAFDFILWLLGKPTSVIAEIDTLLNPNVPDDNGIAVFRFEDGCMAEVMSSFTCIAGENTTEIVGERGVIIQNFGDAPSANVPRVAGGVALKWFLQDDGAWQISKLEAPPAHGSRIAFLAQPLLDFLKGKRNPVATADEGRTALQMILASYESAATGRRIEIS